MKIGELLLKYETDKNHGTIKNIYGCLDNRVVVDNPEPYIGHTYGDSYDEIFENFVKEDEINFLEIGVQKGGSMLAWKDYFKNGKIYGVDIKDAILDEYRPLIGGDDFTYILSDIKELSVKETLKDVKFDIIIDDGSHQLSDVIYVVNNYLTSLNNGGVLIVEDCQQPEHWLREIKKITPNGYEVTTKDLRSTMGRVVYDNYLIIIKEKI